MTVHLRDEEMEHYWQTWLAEMKLFIGEAFEEEPETSLQHRFGFLCRNFTYVTCAVVTALVARGGPPNKIQEFGRRLIIIGPSFINSENQFRLRQEVYIAITETMSNPSEPDQEVPALRRTDTQSVEALQLQP